VRYLSKDWIAAADAAVKATATSAPAGRVVVDQTIDDVVSYRVTIDATDPSVIEVSGHGHTEADATFRQTAATASAVAQGHTDAHQAFLLGHIQFTGDISLLIERRSSFEWLASALAPVLAKTTFAD